MFCGAAKALMKRIFYFVLLIGFSANAQAYTVDTLPNASAYINSFSLLPFTGINRSGGNYIAGFNEYFDTNGKPQELELVRIDLTTKKVQYKKITGFKGGKGFYWNYTFDNAGNLYLSMFYPTKRVLQLSLKDSIAFKDLGNPFRNGGSVIYSLANGRDGNVYFGGSIDGTFWSEYNSTTKTMDKHAVVDANDVYVLSIAGDTDYVYVQTGQRKAINLWAVNKHNDQKRLLFTIPNNTRFDLSTNTGGIYVRINTDTLKATFVLVNGIAKKPENENKNSRQISSGYEREWDMSKKIITYFDQLTSQVFFSYDNKHYDSVYVHNRPLQTTIRKLFAFPNDKENIYFAGEYYGNYYRYNIKEKKAYLLGATGYNIYSYLALNDSMMYMSGYPSGYIMLWNKNKPWTTQKFINGKLVAPTDGNANPRILHYWKGEGTPSADFHHTYQLLKDSKGNLIGAGDVIRIGNAASIGVFNAEHNKIYGINYEPFTTLNFAGIALWNDKVVYSMRATGTKKPKLYIYDPSLNKMVDSIDAGFNSYGLVFVQNNIVTGVANNRIYAVSLNDKKLLYNYSFADNSISGAYLLHDGRIAVNSSVPLPATLTNFVVVRLGNYLESNNMLYGITGNYIVRARFK